MFYAFWKYIHIYNGATEMIKEIIANLRDEVENIVFRMDSGYFSEEIAEVIEKSGYQYVVKAKEYSNKAKKFAVVRELKSAEDRKQLKLIRK